MEEIQAVLHDYFKSWNDGFKSTDATAIKNHMSEKFTGYWAHSKIDAPEVYDYSYDIEGVLSQTPDAHKSFEIHTAVIRNNGEEYLVLGKESNIISGKTYTAQCMFVWRKESEHWKLVREYIELES